MSGQVRYRYERREDPDLVGPYAKDPAAETFLETLNAALAPHADAEYLDLAETYPTLHVIGVPRSGTTLLHQALASRLELGYVNNLIAAFWRAPTYGIQLSKKLGLDQLASTFESSFGRTAGIAEPHEFGYFWNDHLRYPDLNERPAGHEDTIAWSYLRRVLVNMSHRHAGPFMFKPMLLIWHLEKMVETMPRTCYVWIRRDPVQTALSLLQMRRSLFGTFDRWASLKPREPSTLSQEPPWRQVTAQVILLERTIDHASRALGSEHVHEVRYEDFCSSPERTIDAVKGLLSSKGFEPQDRAYQLTPFTERRSELEPQYGARVEQAFEELSGELAALGATGN